MNAPRHAARTASSVDGPGFRPRFARRRPSITILLQSLAAAKISKIFGRHVAHHEFVRAAITELAEPFGCSITLDKDAGDLSIQARKFEVAMDISFAEQLIYAYFSPTSEMLVGDGYVMGKWRVTAGRLEDVLSLFWNVKNSSKAIRTLRLAGNMIRFKRSQRNDPRSSKQNIQYHYDDRRDNLILEKILGSRMLYSSAIYDADSQPLDQAQDKKISLIMTRLNLSGEEDVLEIGSGWGSLSIRMAERSTSVTGITLSKRQIEYCRNILKSSGHPSPQFVLEDYRTFFRMNNARKFDRIVCVEVLDHIGLAQYETFFGLLKAHLKPGGRALFQLILRPEKGQTSKWIDTYIYPGGYIPCLDEVLGAAARAGLGVSDLSPFDGSHYARTLCAWRANLTSEMPRLASEMGIDAESLRKWDFFLAYSKSSFEEGGFSTALLTLCGPQQEGAAQSGV